MSDRLPGAVVLGTRYATAHRLGAKTTPTRIAETDVVMDDTITVTVRAEGPSDEATQELLGLLSLNAARIVAASRDALAACKLLVRDMPDPQAREMDLVAARNLARTAVAKSQT